MKLSRIEKEKRMIAKMIDIYYKKKDQGTLEEREELKAYALKRLTYCKYGENKGFCSKCPTHCYTPKYKEKIKKVMRYSGPRLILHHPIMLMKHIIKDIKG